MWLPLALRAIYPSFVRRLQRSSNEKFASCRPSKSFANSFSVLLIWGILHAFDAPLKVKGGHRALARKQTARAGWWVHRDARLRRLDHPSPPIAFRNRISEAPRRYVHRASQ